MPVGKGRAWGEAGDLPADLVEVASDAEAAAVLERARHDRSPYPPLGLLGGDLARTLGGGGGERGSGGRGGGGPTGVRCPVDLGVALLDGRIHLFVAHLVARTRLWTRAFVAMNAQWVGDWDLGPRAHPGDGLLDTYDVRLKASQLAAVRARVGHGSHLPHPGIREKRSAAVQVELDRPLPVWLDGVRAGRARHISVRLEPDALVVYV